MLGVNEHGCTEEMPAVVQVLSKNILATLSRHYPHVAEGWTLTIDQRGGILQVRNILLSGKMGFQMKISAIDPELHNVVRYAGELLERYRISREKLTKSQAIENIMEIPRNRIGDTIHDK